MNVKDKQTGMKILVANLVYLLAIVVAILPFIAYGVAEDYKEMNDAKNTVVEVEAEITQIDKRTRVDDDGYETVYYEVKVSYVYDGVAYEDVHYDYMSAEPMEGSFVTTKIDPEKPGEIAPDEEEIFASAAGAQACLLGVAVGWYWLIKYLTDKILQKTKSKKEYAADIVAGLCVAGVLIAEGVVFYTNHQSLLLAKYSAVAAVVTAVVFGISIVVKKIKENKKIMNEGYPPEA